MCALTGVRFLLHSCFLLQLHLAGYPSTLLSRSFWRPLGGAFQGLHQRGGSWLYSTPAADSACGFDRRSSVLRHASLVIRAAARGSVGEGAGVHVRLLSTVAPGTRPIGGVLPMLFSTYMLMTLFMVPAISYRMR
jgi:hypothetical protein